MKPGATKPIYAYAVVNKAGEILRVSMTKDVAHDELHGLLAGTDLTDLRIVDVHVRGTTVRDLGRF